jgi:hypothetical protein
VVRNPKLFSAFDLEVIRLEDTRSREALEGFSGTKPLTLDSDIP